MALENLFSFLSTFLPSNLFTCGRIFHAGCLFVRTQRTFSEVLPASQTQTQTHKHPDTQTPRHPNTNIETVATP